MAHGRNLTCWEMVECTWLWLIFKIHVCNCIVLHNIRITLHNFWWFASQLMSYACMITIFYHEYSNTIGYQWAIGCDCVEVVTEIIFNFHKKAKSWRLRFFVEWIMTISPNFCKVISKATRSATNAIWKASGHIKWKIWSKFERKKNLEISSLVVKVYNFHNVGHSSRLLE